MAVGGADMLSTSNYEARKYGVRAAMPGFIGKKLCPDLIIVPLHFDKYREVSYQVREVLSEYDPNFVSVSLDEAYLDFTECLKERRKGPSERAFVLRQRDVLGKSSSSVSGVETGNGEVETVEFSNDVEDVVREMRFKIEQKTQLTASAGIAPNAMLAKVCSDRNKPNGQFYLKPDREKVLDFVRNLPIRKISGIGRVSEQMLKALGIENCADLYSKRDLLYLLHSQISCRFLLRVCLGLGDTRLEGGGPRKSLGTETTFSEINKPEELYRVCENLSQDVVKSLKSEGLKAKTVTVKLKTVAFDLKVRSHSFPTYVTSFEEIFLAAKDLLCHEIKALQPRPLRLRLMGVRLSNFQECDSSGHNRESRQDTITNFLSRKNQVIKHSASPACDGNVVSFEGTSPYSSVGGACVEEETTGTLAARQDCSKVSDDPSCSGLASDLLQSNVNPTPSADNHQVVGGTQRPQPIDPSAAGNTTLICPICGDAQTSRKAEYLEDFNKHVDLCLSKSAIKEMLSKDRERSTQRDPREERDGAPQVDSRKRRKSDSRGSSKKMTLHEFWAK